MSLLLCAGYLVRELGKEICTIFKKNIKIEHNFTAIEFNARAHAHTHTHTHTHTQIRHS